MQPEKSILNPAFRYIPAAQTNLAKTFARIRKEQQQKSNAPKRK